MRKLIMSIMTSILIMISIVTSTYAFIVVNKNVQVEDINFNIASQEGILISTDGINFSTGIGYDEIKKAIFDKTGVVYDNASYDGVTLKQQNGNIVYDEASEPLFVHDKLEASSNSNEFTHTYEDAAKSEYVAFDLYFTATSTSTSSTRPSYDIVLTDNCSIKGTTKTITLANSLSTMDGDYVSGDQLDVNVADAMRIGVLTDSYFEIYEPNIGLGSYAIQNGKDDIINPNKNAMYTYYNNTNGLSKFTYAAEDGEAFFTNYEFGNESIGQLVFDNQNNKYNVIKTTIYVWLDGWDADYFMGVPTDNVKINLEFSLIEAKESYTVTYHKMGYGIDLVQKENRFTLPSVLPRLYKNGYNFEGWYYDRECTKEANPNDEIKSDVDLYAKWTPVDLTVMHKVTFLTTEGPYFEKQYVLPNEEIYTPEVDEYEKHYWNGWFIDSTYQTRYEGGPLDGDVILYGQWLEIININWYSNNELVQTDRKLEFETIDSLSLAPIEGYAFEGWYIDPDFKTRYDFESELLADINLYAKWTKIHTITFVTNGGVALPSQEVLDGAKLQASIATTRDGYQFDGWYTDYAFTTKYNFDSEVHSDMTLYAKWLKKIYVNYMENSSDSVPNESILEGDKVTKPNNPTKDGYTFGGWYIDVDCTIEFDFNSPVTVDMIDEESRFILYAKWIEN